MFINDTKVIDIISKIDEEVMIWENIYKQKINIYKGIELLKSRCELIKNLIRLNEKNHAKVEIFSLLSEKKNLHDLESKYVFNLCMFFNYILDKHENAKTDIINIKDVLFLKINMIGENLDYYPDMTIVPTLIVDGVKKLFNPIYNNGLMIIEEEVLLKAEVQIRVNFPATRDGKVLGIRGYEFLRMKGFSLYDVIYEEYSTIF